MADGVKRGQFGADVDIEAKAAEIVAHFGGAEADAFLDVQRLDLVGLQETSTAALPRDVTTTQRRGPTGLD